MNVSYIEFSVFHIPSSKSSSSSKSLIGTCRLDVASIVHVTNSSTQIVTLFGSDSRNTSSSIETSKHIGRLLLGIVYAPMPNSTMVQTSSMDNGTIPDSLLSSLASASGKYNVSIYQLHLALGNIQVSAATINSIYSSGDRITLQCRTANTSIESITAVSHLCLHDNQLSWSSPNISLQVDVCDSAVFPIEWSLIRSKDTKDCNAGAVVLAEAVSAMNLNHYLYGAPVNWLLPLRASTNKKFAILQASAHATCSSNHAAGTVAEHIVTNEFGVLHVVISDGRISIPGSSVVEPFFECTLLSPVQNLSSSKMQSCTEFVRDISIENTERWSVDTKLNIPLLKPEKATDEMMIPCWQLVLICKDASKYSYPAIGSVKVNIPWKFISENIGNANEVIDQWLDLSAMPWTTNQNSSVGRIRVRLSFSTSSSQSLNTAKGIGAVVTCIQGLRERSDDEELLPISEGSMTSFTLNEESFAAIVPEDENSTTPFHQSQIKPITILSVPGGQSQVKVEALSSINSHATIIGSFPAMRSLPSLPQAVPNLELPVITGLQSRQSSLRMPRMQISSCYVPYIQGSLIINIKNFAGKLSHDSLFLRAVLDDNTHAIFDITPITQTKVLPPISRKVSIQSFTKLKSTPSKQRSSHGSIHAGIPSSVSNISLSPADESLSFELNINTFDHLQCKDWSNSHPFRLKLSLLSGNQPCSEEFMVDTLPLYHLASRAAAGSKMNSSNDRVGISPPISAHLSFRLPSANMSDDSTNLLSMTTEVSFAITDVSSDVTKQLVQCRNINQGSDLSRIELALKQAFIKADVDQSGSVSSAELLQVLQGESSVPRRRLIKGVQGDNNVGMEDCLSLLMKLANIDSNEKDVEDLSMIVSDIFRRLDVDGDGMISWWEWKNVLTSSLIENPAEKQSSSTLNPMDPLVLTLFAAIDALKSNKIETSRDKDSFTSIALLSKTFLSTPLKSIPLVPISTATTRSTSIFGQSTFATPLRQLNAQSTAASRYGSPSTWDENLAALKKSLGWLPNSKEVSTILEALENEKRNMEILSLLQHRSNSIASENLVASHRSSNHSLNERFQQQSKLIHELREKRTKKMNAMLTISSYLRKFIKKFRKEKANKQYEMLQYQLVGAITRKKFLKHQKRKQAAAIWLQKLIRGYVMRRRMQRMKRSASLIQQYYRRYRLKRLRYEQELANATVLFSSQYRAKLILSHCLQKHILRLREMKNRSAVQLQSLARRKFAKKELLKLKEEKAKRLFLEKAKLNLENLSATQIQRMVREKIKKQKEVAMKEELAIKHQAALKIQRSMRKRLCKHLEVRAQVQYDVVRRPLTIDQCRGHRIRLSLDLDGDGIIDVSYGTVVDIDEAKYQLLVNFDDVSSANEALPYKSPHIVWLRPIEPPSDIDATIEPKDEEEDRATVAAAAELQLCKKPDIEDSIGYRILVEDGEDSFRGVIQSYDLKKKLIYVLIEDDEEPEPLPYRSELIKWMTPEQR
jgi:Ca2+-binding EF-hand superfamily protein